MTKTSTRFIYCYIVVISLLFSMKIVQYPMDMDYKIYCFLILILGLITLNIGINLYTKIVSSYRVEYEFRKNHVKEYGVVEDRKDIENIDNTKILVNNLNEFSYTVNNKDNKISYTKNGGGIENDVD